MVRGRDRFLFFFFMVMDMLAFILSFLFTWWLKFDSGVFVNKELHLSFGIYFIWITIYATVAVIIGYSLRIYNFKKQNKVFQQIFKVVQTQLLTLFILLSLLFILKEFHISRYFLALFLISNIILFSVFRIILLQIFKKIQGINKQRVLVIGAGSLGKRFYDNLQNFPELGFQVVGFLDDHVDVHEENNLSYSPIIGKVSDLDRVLAIQHIDEVIIALPLHVYERCERIISQCETAGVRVLIIPDYFDYLPAKPHFEDFAGMPLISIRDIPLDEITNRLVKRAFDICFSLAAIIMTLPVMAFVAVGVMVSSPGPIIFKQERVGLNRRTFTMYKFRSMRIISAGTVDTGWTTANDPRKTKFGSFIRKTSLDELPQFFNVLFGHMSVVGPRPERPYYVEQFKSEIPKYMVKHHVRPGITGLAQSKGLRGDTSITDRINEDIFYIENWSFLFDIKIIIKTIINGFVNKNAY